MYRNLAALVFVVALAACTAPAALRQPNVPTSSARSVPTAPTSVMAPTQSLESAPASTISLATATAAARAAVVSPRLSWRSAFLDGDVYASPIVANGRVYVATQGNSVYALDEATGRTLWQTTIGPPVPISSLPCGDISTTGILGRPALSTDGSKLFAVAFVAPGTHSFVVLDSATGKILVRQSADPPGANPLVQQQRSALVAASGRVYVAYGGLYGDCGAYHGWVVAMDPSTAQMVASYQVPTNREGGIWAPGSPLVGPSGDLYVATGNGDATQTFDYGDSVLRLSPSLTLSDYFAPTNWATLNADDTDIGSTAPTSVGTGLIFQIGKSGYGYLLHADRLGGIGGEAFGAQVCGSAFGGTTYAAPYVYVPCVDGMRALQVDPNAPSFKTAWTTALNFPGQPVLAAGVFWTITRDGYLVGLAPGTGSQLSRIAIGSVMHFASPTAADGHLFVPGARQIGAFETGG